ncbi:sulfite exporter TauE/SafE family protein [Armatimonas sp.]|uniref:sulfite exporter TauE/SafE family protein n=1 Tax=Armatimonas sp. TaxID=1872638 RepID=UPI00286B8B8D|nr:sulfite exporter TauE/SafE family protein [Armatimonas sp.]
MTFLPVLIFLAALLYASVGHAGASGYLAAMALVGMSAEVMKPSALVLNLLVSSIGTVAFARAGAFSWRLFWPFALGAIPLAYFGGAAKLDGSWYKPLVGVVLLVAAVRLLFGKLPTVENTGRPNDTNIPQMPPIWLSVLLGAGIGFLAGLTGTGGGIFLTPLLLLMGWAKAKEAAGTSVAFILVNSLAGLAGKPSSLAHLPPSLWLWAIAAVAGGSLGAILGSKRLPPPSLRRLLALVLLIAAAKLIFTIK